MGESRVLIRDVLSNGCLVILGRVQERARSKGDMKSRKIKSTLLEALDESGKLLRSSIKDRNVVAKKYELSLVTATNHASEETIVKIIRQAFPDHALLTEESPPMGDSSSRWIIDPIDGTTNYAHTLPVACVSIAFDDHGEILFGGVNDPFSKRTVLRRARQGCDVRWPANICFRYTYSRSIYRRYGIPV